MKNIWIKIRKTTRKYVSPVFIGLLFVSTVMWYLTKLSYNYTAEVPVQVELSGNRFRVIATAEGPGYRLMVHRVFNGGVVRLDFSDVRTSPSVINHESYIIDPYSLQNAISLRLGDIRIISLGNIPEITITQ